MSSNSNYTAFIKAHLYRTDLINLWPASILTAVLMIVTRCLTCKQASDSIQWSVYLTVAAAFGVSVATESSGVARAIADLFVSICECDQFVGKAVHEMLRLLTIVDAAILHVFLILSTVLYM